MSERYCVDTRIVMSAHDTAAGAKHDRAKVLRAARFGSRRRKRKKKIGHRANHDVASEVGKQDRQHTKTP
jgi:hypothetical protein